MASQETTRQYKGFRKGKNMRTPNPYDPLPVLRISLENVARDFHYNVMATHTEISEYIEKEIPNAIKEFTEKELNRTIRDIVRQNINSYISRYLGEEKMRQTLLKHLDESIDKVVSEVIKEEVAFKMIVAENKKQRSKEILRGTRAWKALQLLWQDE